MVIERVRCKWKLEPGGWMRRIARGAMVAGWMSAAVFALGQQMPGASQQKPEQKTYRIAGTVTNAVTGDAVAGATMTLRAGQPRETIQTAVTDANGHFELQPVEAGKYSLIGLRRGTSPRRSTSTGNTARRLLPAKARTRNTFHFA